MTRLSTFDIYSANFNKIYMYYIDNIEKIRSYNFNLTNLQIISKVKENYLSMIQKLKIIKHKSDFDNVHFIEKTLDYIEKVVKTSNIDPLIEECKFYNIMYDIFNSDIKSFLV